MLTKTTPELLSDLVTLMAETSTLIEIVQPDAPTTAGCMRKGLECLHEAHHWLSSAAPQLEDLVSARIDQLAEEYWHAAEDSPRYQRARRSRSRCAESGGSPQG